MKINRLIVKNFKGFESREFTFHSKFNLIVGVNGAGKTSVLDALGVAVGSWFLGISGAESRHIRQHEVMLGAFKHEGVDEKGEHHVDVQWERIYPCEVSAHGFVHGQDLSWSRTLNSSTSRTNYVKAANIKRLAVKANQSIRKGEDISLPLISYYGTGRLWQEPRDSFQVTDPMKVASKEDQSRLSGYLNSVDPRLSVNNLTRWIARQSWIAYQQKGQIPMVFRAVKDAMLSCIEEARSLDFNATHGEVIVELSTGRLPFSLLSDGQRCVLAMVGDIALKAAKLNPHFGSSVLKETSGVVLIDELDLHLHPRWQRRIIEDLRRSFPNIQFICTTHSPFLIQSLRSGEELINLDNQSMAEMANKSIEEVAQSIQGVTDLHVSKRYEEMEGAAKRYFEILENGSAVPSDRLDAFKKQLAEELMPYADNPAFQAFLEMKRAAKMGD